ncbi:MAG: hypothetical protein EOO11_20075, partial [Chitinophagaceae bacterium]
MKKLTASLLLLSLFVLGACRRNDVERPVTEAGFFAGAPRLILATYTMGTSYLKVITDAAARTLTLSGDTSSTDAQIVYYYAADGTLTR